MSQPQPHGQLYRPPEPQLYSPPTQANRAGMSGLKGGVGKTTITINTAAGITRLGYRALVVDADPQGTATEQITRRDPDEFEHTIGTMLAACSVPDATDELLLTEALRALVHVSDPRLGLDGHAQAAWGDLWLLPCNPECGSLEIPPAQLRLLSRVLDVVMPYLKISYAFSDMQPSSGPLTRVALYALQNVFAVAEPAPGAIRGLAQLIQTVTKIQPRHPSLNIRAFIVNKYNHSWAAHQRGYIDLQEQLGSELYRPALGMWGVPTLAEEARLPIHAMPISHASRVADWFATLIKQYIVQEASP